MFQRRALCICFVVALAAMWAYGVAASDSISKVTFTGPIFDKVENGVVLCAQVCPAVSGVPISFHGRTVFGLEFDAGPVYTNAVGRACTVKIVPQGVYEVYAFEGLPEHDGFGVQKPAVPVFIASSPAAVTVWADFANPPASFLSFAEWVGNPARKATFGAMSIMSPPYGAMSFQLLYLDGMVEVQARSMELMGMPGPDAFEIYGGCTFNNGINTFMMSAHYLLHIESIGGVPSMGEIKVTDFAMKVLYDSGLHPLMDVNINMVMP